VRQGGGGGGAQEKSKGHRASDGLLLRAAPTVLLAFLRASSPSCVPPHLPDALPISSPSRYHKTNSGLDLLISNLRLKQQGLTAEVLIQRTGKADAQSGLRELQARVQNLASVIQASVTVRCCRGGRGHKYGSVLIS
jgi:hypothetical protein